MLKGAGKYKPARSDRTRYTEGAQAVKSKGYTAPTYLWDTVATGKSNERVSFTRKGYILRGFGPEPKKPPSIRSSR